MVQVLPGPDNVTIIAVPKPSQSACPLCGGVSGQVHSHYLRTLADLPWQGRAVSIQVRARRFRCMHVGCPRRIFTERLPAVAPPRARRTARLGSIQRQIGFALGGEPGSRLAAQLSMPLSGDTLLRLIRKAELEPHPPPRVAGIDDWSWRRGQRYGTIICDLERRRVIDILPERSTEAVATWLRQHPGVEVIARDRAGVYAEGARQGDTAQGSARAACGMAGEVRLMPFRSQIAGTCCAISVMLCRERLTVTAAPCVKLRKRLAAGTAPDSGRRSRHSIAPRKHDGGRSDRPSAARAMRSCTDCT